MDDVQLTQSVISPAPAKQSTELDAQSMSQQASAEQSTVLDARSMSQQAFASMDPVEQLSFLSDMLTLYLQQNTQLRVPPSDFIHLAIQGMERLHKAGRMNVIYLIVKALGTTRPDGSDSLLPTSRMPMGLVEHIVNFFTATSVQQVRQHYLTSFIVY